MIGSSWVNFVDRTADDLLQSIEQQLKHAEQDKASIDAKIKSTVRSKVELESKEKLQILKSKQIIEKSFSEIEKYSEKADEIASLKNNLKIEDLLNAKRNILAMITALKNMQMLKNTLTSLEGLCQTTILSQRRLISAEQLRQILDLYSVSRRLLSQYKTIKDSPFVQPTLTSFTRISEFLESHVRHIFENGFSLQGKLLLSKSFTLLLCQLADELDAANHTILDLKLTHPVQTALLELYRSAQLTRFYEDFGSSIKTNIIYNLDRVKNWFFLKLDHILSEHEDAFPASWDVPASFSKEFLSMINSAMKENLDREKNHLDLSFLKDLERQAIDLEKYVQKKLGLSPGLLTDSLEIYLEKDYITECNTKLRARYADIFKISSFPPPNKMVNSKTYMLNSALIFVQMIIDMYTETAYWSRKRILYRLTELSLAYYKEFYTNFLCVYVQKLLSSSSSTSGSTTHMSTEKKKYWLYVIGTTATYIYHHALPEFQARYMKDIHPFYQNDVAFSSIIELFEKLASKAELEHKMIS